MATGGSRFNDKEYINWLRATLSLMYMKEGLESFTDNQATRFHNTLLSSLGSAPQLCTNHCTSSNIKKDLRKKRWHMTCPTCDTWLQIAIPFHRNAPFPRLSPENTDPQLWQKEPWEIIKLYIPYGCEKKQSARDIDSQGILSLYINCTHFSNGLHISCQDLLPKLIDMRNDLLHSSNFKVSDNVVQGHFKTITDFLHGVNGFTSIEKKEIKEAIQKVQQLQTNLVEISMNKELELRALQQRQIAVERELRSLDVIQEAQGNLGAEVKLHGQTLKELKETQKRFYEFLEQNDLMGDMAKITKNMKDMDQRVQTLEGKMKAKIDVPTDDVEDLETQCKELQQYLLHIYGKQKYWKDPLTSDEAFLSQMYVQPSTKRIREIDAHGRLAEERGPSKLTYKHIFTSKDEKYENIYISGDAGTGKTTFCNKLILDWCDAIQKIQNETVTAEDQRVLADFKFLFAITLRNFEKTYHVEEMIQENLYNNAPKNLSEILKNETCLIVLDGLDEWSCPDNSKKCSDINRSIPGRYTVSKRCVFLTTTRHWKLDVIALENKDVDKHIELNGIDEDSSKELTRKMLDYLNEKTEQIKQVYDFYIYIHLNNLQDFITVPVLLILLVSLWHAGKDIGNSQLELYCSVLDFLFERSEKNLSHGISVCTSTPVSKLSNTPHCLNGKYFCKKYATLLHCLAILAYKVMFNNHEAESLVFKSTNLDAIGMSASDIELCLQCGILTQGRDNSNYTGNYKRLSFVHKEVKEFLAAVYFVTSNNVEIFEEVQHFCKSLDIMLEMNQFWFFVSGMGYDMTKKVFEHFAHVVNADERVREYRQTLELSRTRRKKKYYLTGKSSFGSNLITIIQRFVSDCILEGINNGKQCRNSYLQDFLIKDHTHRDVDRILCCSDMSNVMSVHIYSNDIDAAKLETVVVRLQKCRSLQKLSLHDFLPSTDQSSSKIGSALVNLVKNNCKSLTSLDLRIGFTATNEIVTAICKSISNSLMALYLSHVTLTHRHIEQILYSLSRSYKIRQLHIGLLYCVDHDLECRPRLDMSAMKQLTNLTLAYVYVICRFCHTG